MDGYVLRSPQSDDSPVGSWAYWKSAAASRRCCVPYDQADRSCAPAGRRAAQDPIQPSTHPKRAAQAAFARLCEHVPSCATAYNVLKRWQEYLSIRLDKIRLGSCPATASPIVSELAHWSNLLTAKNWCTRQNSNSVTFAFGGQRSIQLSYGAHGFGSRWASRLQAGVIRARPPQHPAAQGAARRTAGLRGTAPRVLLLVPPAPCPARLRRRSEPARTRAGSAARWVSPPRRDPVISAAMTPPTTVSSSVPIASEAAMTGITVTGTYISSPAIGEKTVSGRPVVSQCASIFASRGAFGWHRTGQQPVQHTVMVIGGKEPVQR